MRQPCSLQTRPAARGRRRASGALVVAGLCSSLAAQAVEPTLQGSLRCPEAAPRGRVVCELELEVASGRLEWADALVVAAPDFAKPLRSRVGGKEATASTPRRRRLPIALAATSGGEGELVVRGRAVHCVGDGCRARTVELRAKVVVE